MAMQPRFNINDIIALPDQLRATKDRPAFFSSPRAVQRECYSDPHMTESLDGRCVIITGHAETLLGLSVPDADSFTYQAQLITRIGKRWRLTGADNQLAIPGNLIAAAKILELQPASIARPTFTAARPLLSARQPDRHTRAALRR